VRAIWGQHNRAATTSLGTSAKATGDTAVNFAVPDFVRKLPECADFWHSVFTVRSYMSEMSILEMCQKSVIYAAIGE
jgi:hypothetical protein